jgi:hypothetical protein
MTTLSQLEQELNMVRATNPAAFGVFYQSQSNPQNRHYVILRSEQEFTNLKQFHREYDFKFNVLAI